MISTEELLNIRYRFLNDVVGISRYEAELFDFDGELFYQTSSSIFDVSDITLHKEETEYERNKTIQNQ